MMQYERKNEFYIPNSIIIIITNTSSFVPSLPPPPLLLPPRVAAEIRDKEMKKNNIIKTLHQTFPTINLYTDTQFFLLFLVLLLPSFYFHFYLVVIVVASSFFFFHFFDGNNIRVNVIRTSISTIIKFNMANDISGK